MDAKEILELPNNALPIPQEMKSRPPNEPQQKHDAISRELYMLSGGVSTLMPSIDTSQLKKRPPADEKVRVVNGFPPTGDYPFAKYNKAEEDAAALRAELNSIQQEEQYGGMTSMGNTMDPFLALEDKLADPRSKLELESQLRPQEAQKLVDE